MAKKTVKRSRPADDSPALKSFEEAIAEVRDVVTRLESGEISLGDALDAYEEGVASLKSCQSVLQAAESKITLLSGFDADGNPIMEPMPSMGGSADGLPAGRRATGPSAGSAKPTRGGRTSTAPGARLKSGNARINDENDPAEDDLDGAAGLF